MLGDAWIDEWQEGFERRAAQAQELSRRMERLTAGGSDRRGLVTVSVDASGVLQELRLDPRIRDRTPAETAELIMTAYRSALADLTAKVTAATAETVGVDTEVGQAIVDAYARRAAERLGDG